MKFSIIKSLVAAGLGLLLSASAGAQAQSIHQLVGSDPLGSWGGPRWVRMLDTIEATPEQRERIRQIESRLMQDTQPARLAHRQLMADNLRRLACPEVDGVGIEANRQAMMQHHERISQSMARAMVEIAQTLTPEQRAQWSQFLTQAPARKGRKRADSDAAR